MYNLQQLATLSSTQVQTNISQGAYRAFFFDVKEFALSRVEFNSVFYSEADPESELINGTYSFAYIRQDKLRTIHAYDTCGNLIPFNNFLNRFNIKIQTRNLFKTGKYLSRVFRPVRYGAFFNNLNVYINNNHSGKQTDGISLISVNLAQSLGWHNAEAGMSAQFTLFFSKGLVKGHCVISDKISSDVVVYGMDNIKQELSLGSSLHYVALEPVKLGENLRMDIQTLLNLWNVFGPEQYLSWAHTSIQRCKEDLILGRLSRYLDDFDDITTLEYIEQRWTLKKALYHKVEYQRFPGLLRLGWTMLKNSIRTYAENKNGCPVFRIPVPDGKRGYLRPDLRMHDEYGNFKCSLQAGTVELDKHGNLWIKPDEIEATFTILGGSDADDAVGLIPIQEGNTIIYRNPNQYGEVVLRQFLFCGVPVSSDVKLNGKIPSPAHIKNKDHLTPEYFKTGNQILDDLLSTIKAKEPSNIEYNKENLLRALINILNNTASIGAVANAEMIRTGIGIKNKSLHKLLMKQFPWNLERVIDSSIKDGLQAVEDMQYLGLMYEYILQNNLEIPHSLFHRMPERLQTEVKIAETHPVDQLLEALNMLIDLADKDILGQGSANKGNRIAGRIDYCDIPLLEIGRVALDNPFNDKAMAMLKEYNKQIAIMLERTKDLPDKEISRKAGINKIQMSVLETLNYHTPDERTLVVNTWAYEIYKSSASVHDSILWIGDQPGLPGSANDTINMLANIKEAYHIRLKYGLVMERYQQYKEVKPDISSIRVWGTEELAASFFADVKEIIIEDSSAMLGDRLLRVGDEVNISNGIYKVREIVPAISKRDKRPLKNSISVYIC